MVIDGDVGIRTCTALFPNADVTRLKFRLESDVYAEVQDSVGLALIGNVYHISSLTAVNDFATDVRKIKSADQIPTLVDVIGWEAVYIN